MDKWILVSNLQKAIRRGDTDTAVETATRLWKDDNAYLRYRTCVILVEDIGVANKDLLNKAYEGKLGKRWIDAKGGLDWFLENVVVPASRSTKDRTACDWGVISKNNLSSFQTKYGAFELLSLDTAEKIVLESNSLAEKGLAAWRIAGTDLFPYDTLPENIKGDWQRWLDINKAMGVSDSSIEIMKMSQKTQREWHPIYVGLCELASKEHTVKTIELKNKKEKGILLAACDAHTKVGKIAITKFVNQNKELQHTLYELRSNLDYDSVKTAVGKMIFLLEGGKVTPFIEYEISKEVDKTIKQQWQNYYNLPGNQIASVVWRNMELLENCRISAINELYRIENNYDGPTI